MSGIEAAPSIEREHDCPLCDDGEYVRYDGDTVCSQCGYTPTPSTPSSDGQTPWESWWNHRRANYDGFRGDERVRMVGGFARIYHEE